MLGVRLLLACVAAACAGPVPTKLQTYIPSTPTAAPTSTATPPTPAPPADLRPDLGVQIRSRQTQTGSTSGGASVSATGSTQGSASNSIKLAGLGYLLEKASIGNGGVSGSSVSSGDATFTQKAEADTVSNSAGTRAAKVGTSTKGLATTTGKAATVQKTGANAGFRGSQGVIFNQPNSLKALKVRVAKKAGASASSGHRGSTKDVGAFTIENLGGTKLRRVNTVLNPTNPNDSLSSDSGLKQVGKTTGTSSLSATGSTQGSGSAQVGLWTPSLDRKKDVSGNTGVSGNGVSTGNGFFVQGVQAQTELVSTKDGLKVKTGTRGEGSTEGDAGIVEKAGADGKATDVAIVTLADGTKEVRLVNNKKATAVSTSGFSGSGSGKSTLNVVNEGETEVKLAKIDLNTSMPKFPSVPEALPPPELPNFPMTPTSMPSTTPEPTLAPLPVYKKGGK
nr:adult cement protein 10 [Chelonibia testudinaria]